MLQFFAYPNVELLTTGNLYFLLLLLFYLASHVCSDLIAWNHCVSKLAKHFMVDTYKCCYGTCLSEIVVEEN